MCCLEVLCVTDNKSETTLLKLEIADNVAVLEFYNKNVSIVLSEFNLVCKKQLKNV